MQRHQSSGFCPRLFVCSSSAVSIMNRLSLWRYTAPLQGNLISTSLTWLVYTPAEGQQLFHFNNGKAQMLTTCYTTCFCTSIKASTVYYRPLMGPFLSVHQCPYSSNPSFLKENKRLTEAFAESHASPSFQGSWYCPIFNTQQHPPEQYMHDSNASGVPQAGRTQTVKENVGAEFPWANPLLSCMMHWSNPPLFCTAPLEASRTKSLSFCPRTQKQRKWILHASTSHQQETLPQECFSFKGLTRVEIPSSPQPQKKKKSLLSLH